MEAYLATTVNGLSNRLKNLISVLRLSNQSKSNFTQFSDIFENDFVTLDTTINYIPLCTWRIIIKDDDIEIPDYFNNVTLDLPERDLRCRDVDSEYDRIPPIFREKILSIINSFIVRKEIHDIVNNFQINNLTGFHIRTWWSTYHKEYDDWSTFLKSKSNEHYLINFEKKLSSTNENVFLSCDDFKFKFYLKNKYSNIITYERDEKLSDIQNDFVDMLLLSKCKYFYGTKLSTFSEMSWWFGGCEQKVLFT
jgi:hypothetical protein